MNPSSVRIVLIRPTHGGNIGACARAMKTMGLDALWVVAPETAIDDEARAMATHAVDLLERAVRVPDLETALADCRYVMGTSARPRRLGCPVLRPREAAPVLVNESRAGPVALLFGQERTGLTNEELDHCHAVVSIPANPDFPSLNLAAAVQIMAYEIRLVLGSIQPVPTEPEEGPVVRPTREDMDRFYDHLERVMIESQFLDPAKPRFLMRRLKRFFNRANPDDNELNILRGILTAVERWRRP